MIKSQNRKSGGDKKHGRNKKPADHPTSMYVRGKITFEQYMKMRK